MMPATLSAGLMGHPRGLYLVAATEFWERFSFYGLTGLLVLYLVAPASAGGMGWANGDAVQLVGLYAGAAFLAPVVGGWLASRFFGERRCILWGGIAIMAGHIVLGLQALPAIGADGKVQLLYLALVLVVAGTGLLKPTISSIVGRLYPPDSIDREGGFIIFTMCIWMGSFSANFVAGTLGEKVGWHYGFGAAAVGMLVGLLLYVVRAARDLGDIGLRPDGGTGLPAQPLSPDEKRRLFAIFAFSLFTVVYAACFFQYPGILNLFVERGVDRMAGSFEIPATWFISLLTASYVVLAPLSGRMWRALEARGRQPGIFVKQAIGLAILGAAFLVIWMAMQEADIRPAGASLLWIILAYTMFGIADLFIWPSQMTAVTVLAPSRHASLVMGLWWVATGIGITLTGYIATAAEPLGRTGLCLLLAGACGASALFLLTIQRPMDRMLARTA